MSNSYLKASICLSDVKKENIYTAKDGKKYLFCEIHERKTVDQYGNSHFISIRKKNENGQYETEYIGKAETKTFGENAPKAPAVAPAGVPAPKPAPAPAQENEDLPF